MLSGLGFDLANASDNLAAEKPTYTLIEFRVEGWKRAPEDKGDVPIESGPKFSYRGTTTFPYNERARSRIRHSAELERV